MSTAFLIVLVFLAYPYTRMYQIDSALATNDVNALSPYVDLGEVREANKKSINQQLDRTTAVVGENKMTDMLRKGVNMIGGAAVDEVIDLAWVRDTLKEEGKGDLLKNASFSFFESPTRFIIRIGELGNNPHFIQFTLQDWDWRITAIYL